MSETVEEMFQFNKEVTTPGGVTKTVVADSQEALDAAVAAAEAEVEQVRPDIDNPEHGNVTDAEFLAAARDEQAKVEEPEAPKRSHSKKVVE